MLKIRQLVLAEIQSPTKKIISLERNRPIT